MSTTLTAARARCARELGPFHSSTATSGSTTALLEDTAWPIKSTIDQADLYKDQWLFRPAAGTATDKVRYVKTYDPSSGQLTPDQTYTTAPYAGGAGEAYELHAIIEPLTAMKRLINQALKRMLLVVDFTLTPVLNQTRHSLAAAATWLTNPDWVYQVGYLASGDDIDEVDPFARVIRGQPRKDGATVYLYHPGIALSTTDTLYVRSLKAAYDHCKATAGSFGGQAGLNIETDECEPDEEWLASAVLIEAWRDYAHVLEPLANQRLIRDRAEAAAWFTDLTDKRLTVPERTFRPIISTGLRW